jgi:aconitate hydratase 2/2-methylisocitrate dehydratase
LYEADTDRLEAFKNNRNCKRNFGAMLRQNFFTNFLSSRRKVVTYVAGEGDISTDLLSPGNQAHSRSDREFMVNV